MDDVMAKSFWRDTEVGYSFSNSLGRSGGILTMWKKDVVDVENSFKGDGFVGIKVSWNNHFYYVVNVYSPCEHRKKKALWKELLGLMEKFKDGEWILGGDFNAIKNGGERRGRAVLENQREMNLFAEFIDKTLLVDIPCKGKKFSWFSGDGKSKSRIDRFLLSSKVLSRWEVIGQFIGDRDVSDHCPIWVKSDKVNWGPKPFRFNNEWFAFESFIPFVEGEWMSLKIEGRGDFVLKEKLRLLKDKLKWWIKEVFGRIELEMEDGVREMNFADEKLMEDDYANFDENMCLRREACGKFWKNLRLKKSMLLQKSIVNWLKEGDNNSGFFHKIMKQRRRMNHLGPLYHEGRMVETVEEMREEVFNHFNEKFYEDDMSFFEGNFISRAVSSSFLTLIPKCKNPLSLNDYRPICLVGCMYKVVAKLLAGRLKGVLNSIISNSQSAFVPGRQLLDGVLVANEVVDFARKEGKNCLLFKVDFEKAYDKVNWSFLRYMLKRMGFGDKWTRWMELLIFNSKMSVLVNGSPSKEFSVHKSLRQGDPLSPFLFVLVAEGLTGIVKQSIHIGELQNFILSDSYSVDILQFADDTLIMGEGSWKHVRALKAVLRAFEIVSGLGINFHKSGRITLLKSVLSSLAIFTMSFYKVPSRVVKNFTSIQNKFLWGGVEEKRKIHWVKWSDVTLPFEDGGLGVKNINLFNFALLCKWRWRILEGSNSLWYKVLKSRFKVHSGFSNPFWESSWLDERPLREAFPIIFDKSFLKKVSVAAIGGWEEGIWKWGDLGLKEGVLGDEGAVSMYGALKCRLEDFRGMKEGRDAVVWMGKADTGSTYSVASCYEYIRRVRTPHGPFDKNPEAFGILWKSEVPFKVKAFGWRLFRNRLPTLDLLVWLEIAVWVGKKEKDEEDCKANFLEWYNFFRLKKVTKGKERMIWLDCVWTLWILRNSVRFRKDRWSVNDIVWNIKSLAWKWMFCGKITHPNFSYYEFVTDPLLFLSL
ncbi:uncharacterized protein LOC131651145 [Vicia villosa]|uniref:uncharacterized protein LOC131651145 n=1 Tax=Vicia villosa TaxID=3911 RepID=UPI00273C78A5|nr:uncharacterized protein LOC131651145 [Vicia villosa]